MTSNPHDTGLNGAKKPRRGQAWSNVALAIASLTLSLLVIEIALRWRYPITQNSTPSTFDSRVGRIFKPGSETRYTNYFDFTVTQRANSLVMSIYLLLAFRPDSAVQPPEKLYREPLVLFGGALRGRHGDLALEGHSSSPLSLSTNIAVV